MKKYILIILFFIGAIAFATTSQLKMQVFLMMRDLTLEGHPIRLSLHVQGGGHDIRSTQTVVGATPLFLDGGVQMQLTNFELRPYFEFQNLTGLTAAEYSQPLQPRRTSDGNGLSEPIVPMDTKTHRCRKRKIPF